MAETEGQPAPSRSPWARIAASERAPEYAFLVVGVTASVFYGVIGRRLWFDNDEWDFLTKRTAGDLGSLFKSHFGHWSTLPILVYRFLWWSFGLRSYLPYQALIIGLHFLAAWLLLCVMRRAGVRPWIAALTAIVFVLFGRGYQDIVWAFQITQVGSLTFGLAHLLLADHDGPFDRRDRLGLAAGFAGLLCSGVAVAMVAAVGVATLIRRGWRVAALHTAPLAVVYLIWLTTSARNAFTASGTTWPHKAKFVVATVLNAFRATSAFRGGQWLFVALLVGGLVLAWAGFSRAEWSARAATPFALLVGAGVFLVITSLGRAGLPGATYRSRYIDLALAMMLPALGVAADAVIRWRRVLAIPVLAVLVMGIPGNVRTISRYTAGQEQGTDQYRQTLEALPRNPRSRGAPGSLEPLPGISIGWLLAGAGSGRIPAPGAVSPVESATDALRLSLRRSPASGAVTPPCRVVGAPIAVRLRSGDALRIARGTIRVVPPAGPFEGPLPATYPGGLVLTPAVPDVTFRVLPASHTKTRVCGPARVFGAGPLS